MDAVDTLARISQLLLSRRISANLVVGVLVTVGIGGLVYFVLPTIFTGFLALGTTLCALAVVVLLAFGYGVANLFNGTVIDFGKRFVSRRKIAQARKQADANKARAYRQQVAGLCKIIPYLTHNQLKLLEILNDDEHEIAWNRHEFYSEYSNLLDSGFLHVVARGLPGDKDLYRLTAEGAHAFRVYLDAQIASQPEAKSLSQGEGA